MSTVTDVVTPAVAETAGLLATGLGIGAPGSAYDLWAPNGAVPAVISDSGASAWSAALLGPLGPCGEISVVLSAGTSLPSEGAVAAALANAIAPLTPTCGADHVGELQHAQPRALSEPREGQHAIAVPVLTSQQESGLVVVIVSDARPTAEFPHLDPSPGPAAAPRSIAALGDVEMTVSVELGRTKIPIKELLAIHNGAVVQLDRSVTNPVDIFVHGTLIARGEVVVVDECFAVRVTELLAGE